MKAGGLHPRQALTVYRVIRRFPQCTLLEAEPHTGRTHQIRVHLSSLGHPIVGDTLYGAPGKVRMGNQEVKTLARTFLHAAGLEFSHPRSGEALRLSAPMPKELGDFLKTLAVEEAPAAK
jgi:23S rRNA pseudouridine1911/1915/1917 synthase